MVPSNGPRSVRYYVVFDYTGTSAARPLCADSGR
jgi:hypothetical protein